MAFRDSIDLAAEMMRRIIPLALIEAVEVSLRRAINQDDQHSQKWLLEKYLVRVHPFIQAIQN